MEYIGTHEHYRQTRNNGFVPVSLPCPPNCLLNDLALLQHARGYHVISTPFSRPSSKVPKYYALASPYASFRHSPTHRPAATKRIASILADTTDAQSRFKSAFERAASTADDARFKEGRPQNVYIAVRAQNSALGKSLLLSAKQLELVTAINERIDLITDSFATSPPRASSPPAKKRKTENFTETAADTPKSAKVNQEQDPISVSETPHEKQESPADYEEEEDQPDPVAETLESYLFDSPLTTGISKSGVKINQDLWELIKNPKSDFANNYKDLREFLIGISHFLEASYKTGSKWEFKAEQHTPIKYCRAINSQDPAFFVFYGGTSEAKTKEIRIPGTPGCEFAHLAALSSVLPPGFGRIKVKNLLTAHFNQLHENKDF